MNKERIWPRALGAASIVALVLVTNEGYRQVRSLVDSVNQSKHDIALLKRDLYVLQVQLDNGPVTAHAPMRAAIATPMVMNTPPLPQIALPMPAPIGQMLGLPDTPSRPHPKPKSSDEPKSLVSVVLMNEAKPASTPAPGASTAKPAEGPRIDVQLIGDAK